MCLINLMISDVRFTSNQYKSITRASTRRRNFMIMTLLLFILAH
uniref:Uncharacterized protein n=1 Tax=Rhizophora mucronata TaxID=61149 RepID=A0A2P2PAE5_RHIMU